MPDKSVLVVEDHSSVRALLRVILEGEGYRVVEASDGHEALEVAEARTPDLIMLDLMMPEFDGERVIDELQKKPDLAGIPVVVVTAREEGLDRVREKIGRTNVFMKPFEQQELVDRVKELVGPGMKKSSSPWKRPSRRGN